MIEIWKRYDERYEVSSFGNVRNENGVLKLSVNVHGYYICKINSKVKIVHQLVAICFLDHVPCGMKIVVDHVDNNKLNNRVDNLQLTSNRLNCSKDRKTDFTGVFKNRNRFQSKIRFNNKVIYLGEFDTPEEASEHYKKALQSIENGTEIISNKREFTSQYKGVSWDKKTNKWTAIYKGKYLGRFKIELEAHETLNLFLKKITTI